MAIVIAFANQKGGVGKTTLTMNLAGALHEIGYSVCVVDADKQGSSLYWSLAEGNGKMPFHVVSAFTLRGKSLASLPYDFVLVDCPPGVTDSNDESAQLARSVLKAANGIVVPITPSKADFRATAQFVRFLQREKNPKTRVAAVINRVWRNLVSAEAPEVAAELLAPIGGTVFLTTIGNRTAITEVSGSGQTIFQYRPKHIAATEFTNLTQEIMQWFVQDSKQAK